MFRRDIEITAVGNMPGSGGETSRGMCEKFGDCVFLVQDHLGRGTVHRGRRGLEVVDRTLPLAQLGCSILHRYEGDTIVRQGGVMLVFKPFLLYLSELCY